MFQELARRRSRPAVRPRPRAVAGGKGRGRTACSWRLGRRGGRSRHATALSARLSRTAAPARSPGRWYRRSTRSIAARARALVPSRGRPPALQERVQEPDRRRPQRSKVELDRYRAARSSAYRRRRLASRRGRRRECGCWDRGSHARPARRCWWRALARRHRRGHRAIIGRRQHQNSCPHRRGGRLRALDAPHSIRWNPRGPSVGRWGTHATWVGAVHRSCWNERVA